MPDLRNISEPSNVKYLGVYFDNDLRFKRHIDITCCKINRMVGILWKSEHLNLEAKKMIYHIECIDMTSHQCLYQCNF